VLELQSGKLSAGINGSDAQQLPNQYHELQERNEQLEVSSVYHDSTVLMCTL